LVVLDRVQQAMKSQALSFEGSAGTGQLTISGGLSTYPWDGRSGEELFKKADDALLAAKRAGKNRIFLIGDSVLD
jgi:diguanylate cyclase (GGDEF)-like protein